MLKRFGPAIVALAFAVLTAIAAAWTDGRVDGAEWVQIAIQGTTVAGVWLVPAVPGWPHAKTAIAMVLAVENAAIAAVVGGISGQEWVGLAIAGLGVIAVRLTPPPETPPRVVTVPAARPSPY